MGPTADNRPGRATRPSFTHLPPLADPPATVLAYLVARFPHVGEATWRERMVGGLVIDAEGSPLTAATPYRPHTRVAYRREVADEPPAEPPAILHLDEHLVAVDKPPFVPVVPAGGWVGRALLYAVEAATGLRDLAPLHRLDRATAGVVLFARRPDARGAYATLFQRGEVARLYEADARVEAPPAERSWRVASRIVRGTPFFRMREVAGPPNALTDVELVTATGGIGRFQLRPASGKKHQLRLHMAGLGFPILGDRLYPELLPTAVDDPARPLHLVARRISFRDPISGEERVFTSRRPLPGPNPEPEPSQ